MKEIRGKRGQSMLEYVIVLVAIVATLVFALTTVFKRGDTTKGLGKLLNKAAGKITTETGKITTMVP